MIGLAVLDLDGTLVDSAAHCAAIANAMLADRSADRRVTDQEARRHISAGAETLIAALLGEALVGVEADLAEFRRRYAEVRTPAACLYPGVRDGLAALRSADVGLALCSNKPQALCEKVLSDLGLAEAFRAVVGARAGLPPKPDPAALRAAITEAGGDGVIRCHVGDSAFDHQVAARAGLPFILVTYGYAEPGFEATGAPRADSFAAAADLILAILTPDRRRAV